MRLAERLTTIAATATITSAAWILIGGVWYGNVVSGAAPPAATGAGRAEQAAATPHSSANSEKLIIPVAGVTAGQLTDTFEDARAGGTRLHQALDIMAPRGTPVIAAAAGTVEKLFHSNAGGNTIYVRSLDRMTIHYYAHLDSYAGSLHEGQTVAQGETLGAVGSTGDASPDAPHLHFEIMRTTPDAKWYQSATAVDPYPLLAGKQP